MNKSKQRIFNPQDVGCLQERVRFMIELNKLIDAGANVNNQTYEKNRCKIGEYEIEYLVKEKLKHANLNRYLEERKQAGVLNENDRKQLLNYLPKIIPLDVFEKKLEEYKISKSEYLKHYKNPEL